jgi:hypothetical protein
MTQPEPMDTSRTARLASRASGLVLHGLLGRGRQSEILPLSADDASVAERFEAQHFVEDVPLMSELADDPSRVNLISHRVHTSATRSADISGMDMSVYPVEKITEHDALVRTRQFLETTSHMSGTTADMDAGVVQVAAENADIMLHESQFIGEKDLDKAAGGIAALWKSYLHDDPQLKICVPSDTVGTGEEITKSSDYLYGRVMAHFDDAERQAVSDRITTNLDDLGRKANPDHTKVILLDDWSISGTQLSSGFNKVKFHGNRYRPDLESATEINLVAASEQQIEDPQLQTQAEVPVFAYYRAGSTIDKEGRKPFITGAHSSVDFGFADELEKMAAVASQLTNTAVDLPPLANIVRPYRS